MPNGRILHYNVTVTQISPGGDLQSKRLSQRVDEANSVSYTVVFTDLTPFTRFNVAIFAVTRIGPGVAQEREVVTDPDSASPPTNFTATVLNSTAVSLAWGPPETPRGVIEGYNVTVIGFDFFNLTLNSSGDKSSQSFIVANLQPFTTYMFTVQAYSFSSDPFFIHVGEEEQLTRKTSEAGGHPPEGILEQRSYVFHRQYEL